MDAKKLFGNQKKLNSNSVMLPVFKSWSTVIKRKGDFLEDALGLGKSGKHLT